jgi:7,8-didemethyl-8-hydroxy-5-deazariboflavin synthase
MIADGIKPKMVLSQRPTCSEQLVPEERVVTYSPAYTLVPTYECFNRCEYCNFRVDPGQDTWLSLESAQEQLESLQATGVIEILVLSGEVHPQSTRRQAWFQRIFQICELALKMGFLPHTNAGPLSYQEMTQLRQVNASMGLMLEQITPALLQQVHRRAPSKVPGLRLQQLDWAGKLQIPFTTGLLLGIGETPADWRETLMAIANIHAEWGHIQEVILQPYSPGHLETRAAPGFPVQTLPEVVAIARELLPSDITLQIPPNLLPEPDLLLACIEAGARDLGGIVPHDHVNPDYAHLQMSTLTQILQQGGWQLRPRLPVYPRGDDLLPTAIQLQVKRWRTSIH